MGIKEQAETITQSKRLAYLLRHSALTDSHGWIRTEVLIQQQNFTPQELKHIVYEDHKGRFEFSEDGLLVRALYGHSTNVDLGLIPTVPPTTLYHGTADKYLDCIIQEGIKSRKRDYVHLSETIDVAKQVGARHGNSIVLSIDTKSMIEDGWKFYKAKRSVWLVKYIPPQFIKTNNYE